MFCLFMPSSASALPCIPLPGFPLLVRPVPAGFPSPAADYYEERLSLDEHLIEHKEATFFVRVQGHLNRPGFSRQSVAC